MEWGLGEICRDDGHDKVMSQWMTATFLGTSSGGGPSESRNCSSLVLDVVGDGSLWSISIHFAEELWLTDKNTTKHSD